MDIRGIEVTNQLRSAIRAKLLELGVRYDEELPDYILVMVVNKKTRQQMHDDLFLFLEKSTTPFVDWLHDQVLKKLQKVTVAKRKSSREFVPTVVVKKEEDKRKRKINTTSFLQDQDLDQTNDKSLNASTVKQSSQDTAENQKRNFGKPTKETSSTEKSDTELSTSQQDTTVCKNTAEKHNYVSQHSNTSIEVSPSDLTSERQADHTKVTKDPELNTKQSKRSFDKMNDQSLTEKNKETVRAQDSEDELSPAEENANKRLKSAVNKPKVTSVISVKNRLGIGSQRKKFEVYRVDNKNRYAQNEKHFEKRFQNNAGRRYDSSRGRGSLASEEEGPKKYHVPNTRPRESERTNDLRNHVNVTKSDRLHKLSDCREKLIEGKEKMTVRTGGTIKDRLGVVNSANSQAQSTKIQLNQDYRNTKLEQNSVLSMGGKNKNIKNRLGPLKNNFRPVIGRGNFLENADDEDCLNLGSEEDLDDDLESMTNAGPVRSSIIAVQKPPTAQSDKRRAKPLKKVAMQLDSDVEDEEGDIKVPSKVIVTPRPLKPLQPIQKRATQSLLLRAVAEANQSVVAKKNPEPSLLEKKSQSLRPVASREVNKNLSVRLNASKRLVMEKIQVELSTKDSANTNNKSADPEQEVTQEHMGVVMSLFQRSDDKQKFLVTLNGYNNNMSKEKLESEEEEGLQMEVGEEDELALFPGRANAYGDQNDSAPETFATSDANDSAEDHAKDGDNENNENCNTENLEIDEEPQCKRRKLSPIIYKKSPSPTPSITKNSLVPKTTPSKLTLKKPLRASTPKPIADKPREKCRYWPNCTLGNKCAFLHPTVMCSAFPACKFGDKCAYKHPQCKFGLSCTKLGCVFSHSTAKCKYHPYCTKPACPYAHPRSTAAVLSVVASNQRAKFTWRRRD